MAEQVLSRVQDLLEGPIDFEGQRQAELLTTLLLAAVGAVAFVVGFVLQDIFLCLYTSLAGTILTFLIIVPPWPFFNRHPIQWLPRGSSATAKVGIVMDGQKLN
ncbi:MAG: hypothetical protein M1817_006592 [Caeruleum heppii]|nr:MAG: hypothetical protein M1817_006592 [Caeruleum heppii]